jgi:mevalonate kinase
MSTCTGTGHGKAILVGEHHVQTGAVETLPARNFGLDWRDVRLPEAVRRDTLAMITRACDLAGLDVALRLTIDSTVPIRSGLGSSAALAVAALRAAHGLQGRMLAANHLLDEAREVECVVHGRSSGLDPAAAAAGGGAVLFQEGRVLAQVAIHRSLTSARWVMLDLGGGVPTREAIDLAHVHRARLGPQLVKELTLSVSDAARDAARGLEVGDLVTLGDAIARAGTAMEPLGVVDTAMRHVLSLCVEGGALAAKQTGAGLGGMLLALAPDEAVAQRILALTLPHVRAHWLLPLAPSP